MTEEQETITSTEAENTTPENIVVEAAGVESVGAEIVGAEGSEINLAEAGSTEAGSPEAGSPEAENADIEVFEDEIIQHIAEIEVIAPKYEYPVGIPTEMTVRVRCPEGCDLSGGTILIGNADDQVIAEQTLTIFNEQQGFSSTNSFTVQIPEIPGDYVWTVIYYPVKSESEAEGTQEANEATVDPAGADSVDADPAIAITAEENPAKLLSVRAAPQVAISAANTSPEVIPALVPTPEIAAAKLAMARLLATKPIEALPDSERVAAANAGMVTTDQNTEVVSALEEQSTLDEAITASHAVVQTEYHFRAVGHYTTISLWRDSLDPVPVGEEYILNASFKCIYGCSLAGMKISVYQNNEYLATSEVPKPDPENPGMYPNHARMQLTAPEKVNMYGLDCRLELEGLALTHTIPSNKFFLKTNKLATCRLNLMALDKRDNSPIELAVYEIIPEDGFLIPARSGLDGKASAMVPTGNLYVEVRQEDFAVTRTNITIPEEQEEYELTLIMPYRKLKETRE